ALPGHVRFRPVGPQPRNPFHRARPPGRETAVLRTATRWALDFRLRAEIAAGSSRAAAGDRPARRGGLFRLRLRARAAHYLQGCVETLPRAYPERQAGTAGAGPGRVLGCAVQGQWFADRAGGGRGIDRASARVGEAPPD